jgi:protein-S-isoprenylcysteine O-methyltransferase Ste14
MERHRTDVVSLVFGVCFVGVGAAVLFDGMWLSPARAADVWPALLVLVGLWLLVATMFRGRAAVTDAERDQDSADTTAP